MLPCPLLTPSAHLSVCCSYGALYPPFFVCLFVLSLPGSSPSCTVELKGSGVYPCAVRIVLHGRVTVLQVHYCIMHIDRGVLKSPRVEPNEQTKNIETTSLKLVNTVIVETFFYVPSYLVPPGASPSTAKRYR